MTWALFLLLDFYRWEDLNIKRWYAAAAKALQSRPTLWDPIDGSSPGPPRPWDSPGKSTGVGCYFLLQCMKVKRESEVAQLCPTCSNPMDCSLPGSSVHGIFQAWILEWGCHCLITQPNTCGYSLMTRTSSYGSWNCMLPLPLSTPILLLTLQVGGFKGRAICLCHNMSIHLGFPTAIEEGSWKPLKLFYVTMLCFSFEMVFNCVSIVLQQADGIGLGVTSQFY